MESEESERGRRRVNGGKPIECKEVRRHCLSDRNYSIQDFISMERGHSVKIFYGRFKSPSRVPENVGIPRAERAGVEFLPRAIPRGNATGELGYPV